MLQFNKVQLTKKSPRSSSNHTEYAFKHNCPFYVENYFNEMLSVERKRTERSKKPFMLMLLNIDQFNVPNEKIKVVEKIADVLCSTTRAIDTKGWYKTNLILGVLLRESNGVTNNDKETIFQKIIKNLRKNLTAEQIDKIKISFHVFPEEHDKDEPKVYRNDPALYPDLSKPVNQNFNVMKRTIDILGSIMGIIIFLPLFILIPILIKLSSKGPILFKQDRVGQFGQTFKFMKFRTMFVGTNHTAHKEFVKKLINGINLHDDNNGEQRKKNVYKIKNDSRITSIGKFLRKTSLDEIPQFFNVLIGEMSLVGPRPPIPYEVDDYDIWHRRRFLEVKPGITGLWQIGGRSSITFDDMVRLDLKYSNEASLWLDLKILLKTPLAVVTCKGAY